MIAHLWLIPVLPFLGFVLNGLLGRRLGKRFVTTVGVGSVFLALLVTLGAIWTLGMHYEDITATEKIHLLPEQRGVEVTFFQWLPGGEGVEAHGGIIPDFNIDAAFLLDPLSAVMLFVVTFIGFLIHLYSVGYMGADPGYARYFAYLNLFMAMMLVLILGASFPLLFIGWEGVGLCSYLLIGFYFEEKFPPYAGQKAFIVNRIGDAGFVLGMLLVWTTFGSLTFSEVMPAAAGADHFYGTLTAFLIGFLLFIGAMGKSAQIPLFVWLPDAMAGPTPVSALIHAATMVTAGVYMLARCNVLFQASPQAMLWVALIGGVTAVFAATIGLVQTDIKKVLAYSTVSQLGYMFLGCGAGAFAAGIFHVFTHAFFKACLFLGSGSVIHGMHHEQDIRKMGGLKKYMPATAMTFLVSCIAIAGIFPLAGFWSKDLILEKVLFTHAFPHNLLWMKYLLYGLGLGGAFLTAFYMFRLYYLTFAGEERQDHAAHHVHESPWTMTVPLWILAGLACVAGLLGLPSEHWNVFEGKWLHHVIRPVHFPGMEAAGAHHLGLGWLIGLAVVSLSVAGLGIWYATRLYLKKSDTPRAWAERFPGLYDLLWHKWKVDELYEAAVVQPFFWLCRRSFGFDKWIIDGIVNGTALATRAWAWISHQVDKYLVDGAVNGVAGLCRAVMGQALRRWQTGFVQNYLLGYALGFLVFVAVAVVMFL